ncbi:MAG: M23 family metallopeptidase, partial [Bacteroidetes bacterium]|nr:M23 family metallopeptidase [Bacteroidota bacterium]
KLSKFSNTLSSLAARDNELRVAVNLPKIDSQTRLMGTGGTKVENYDGILSKDAGELLASSTVLLGKLDREIEFQKESYKDIYKQSEENKVRFACLPAIKPMTGSFSYHGFGLRTDPILGTPRAHTGVDIHGDVGTPVYATADGVVEFSGKTGSGYGIALEINHGFGYKTWYAHLSRTVAKSGQKVKRGTLIAYSGNSGRSTGPHLHYEVRYNGEKRNPVEFFVNDIDYDKIRAQLKQNEYLVKQ